MRFLICLTFALLVSACKTPPPATQLPTSAKQHYEQLSLLNDWQIQGRILYKDSEDKHSASFSWLQNSDDFELDLTTFIGTSIVHLEQVSNQAIVKADGETYRGTNAQQLLTQLTGWNMPVGQFSVWIKGLPSDIAQAEFAQQGWLNALQYQQWQINYEHYRLVNGLALPHQITIQDSQRLIKLKINQWQIPTH